jgi:hypothetical protein
VGKRIGIVGSRHFPAPTLVQSFITSLSPDTSVISGGAAGVDRCAVEFGDLGHRILKALGFIICSAKPNSAPLPTRPLHHVTVRCTGRNEIDFTAETAAGRCRVRPPQRVARKFPAFLLATAAGLD